MINQMQLLLHVHIALNYWQEIELSDIVCNSAKLATEIEYCNIEASNFLNRVL